MHAHRGIALVQIVLIVAVCATVLAALYVTLIDPYYSRLLRLRFGDMTTDMPPELSDARFLLAPRNGGSLYEQGNLPHPELDLITSDIAFVGDTEAKIQYRFSSGEFELVVDDQTLFVAPGQMRSLFISADGARVSVAVSGLSGKFSSPANEWTVHVFDVASGATWKIEGFAAPFMDTDTVYAFDATGIQLVDYESGVKTRALDIPTNAIYPSVAQSESRTKLGWMTYSGGARVYVMTESSEFPLLALREVADVYGTVTLTEEDLYVLVPRENGSVDLMRYDLFNPETMYAIRSFSRSVAPIKLIP